MNIRILSIVVMLFASTQKLSAQKDFYASKNFSIYTQEVMPALMRHAQDLKKLGLTQEEIIQQFIDALVLESTEQVKPVVSEKTKKALLYGTAVIATVAVIGGIAYWLITSKPHVQNNLQNPGPGNAQVQLPNETQNIAQGVNVNIIQGNIQDQHFTDDTTAAIVNAANEALQGGGGVDGAIHQDAGAAQLQQYCRDNFQVNQDGSRCQAGQAVITPGFNLAPRRIIHTVAPRARADGEWRNTLAQTYQNCMQVADQNNLTAVAFPALGTGIFGCDPQESSRIAVRTVNQYLADHPQSRINEIRFVCWGQNNMQLYRDSLASIS